ncbi:MAG: hypothetical protein M3022_16385 [Actinomycetota bacterium]|nr:hypothetical protein [Actinomycetota bacterium]
MVAVEPEAELGEMFDAAGGPGSRGCDPDVEEHVEKLRSFIDGALARSRAL